MDTSTLKSLNEKRGAKLRESSAIFARAQTEKRDLTDTEVNTAEALQTEVEAIDRQLSVTIRQLGHESQKPLALSRGDQRDVARFDISRLLRSMRKGTALDGIEAEIVEQGEAEASAAGIQSRGIMLPRMVVRHREHRDMSATGTTSTAGDQGGQAIVTQKAGFYDAFFDALVLRNAGATVFEGLSGNLGLPRFVASTDPLKKTENEASGESSPTLVTLTLQPKRLPVFIDISDQLMMQSATNIEQWVRRNVQQQGAAVAERAFFHGTGTSEATGIAATSGIGSVVGGTNGAAPDWADIVDLETQVAIDNALLGNIHYFTNAAVRGKLKKTARLASTDSRMIWEGADLNGYSPIVTNAVSSTLTKGGAVGTASAIFFGNAQDYVMGFWGGMSLELLRDVASAKVGQSVLVMNMYYDGGVIRPVSFSAMLDALTA